MINQSHLDSICKSAILLIALLVLTVPAAAQAAPDKTSSAPQISPDDKTDEDAEAITFKIFDKINKCPLAQATVVLKLVGCDCTKKCPLDRKCKCCIKVTIADDKGDAIYSGIETGTYSAEAIFGKFSVNLPDTIKIKPDKSKEVKFPFAIGQCSR